MMMMKNDGISVVVPVFNSAELLLTFIGRLEPVLRAMTSRFEVILVNDCSRDRSWDVIVELTQKHSWIGGINLLRNYGQHNALLCGIRSANHEIIVTMDDDLQHPPEEIPRLLDKLAEGFVVVYGTPAQEQHGLWRVIASKVTKLALQTSMGIDIAQKVSAFRAFRAIVRDAFSKYQGSFVSIDVLLTWGTTRFSAIPVRHDTRSSGYSNYTFGKLVVHALNMATGFSTLPLQFASMLGFAFTFLGMIALVYVVGSYFLKGGSIPGFPFLASIIVIFSGAQLFALGIIGEYLARIHFRTMDRPPYVIRSRSKIVSE